MEFAAASKCMVENMPLLDEIVQLRKEEAALLGYEDHASFVLEIKMAKTSKAVLQFLDDLKVRLEEPAKKEMKVLVDLKRRDLEKRGLAFDGKLNIWDWRFYGIF